MVPQIIDSQMIDGLNGLAQPRISFRPIDQIRQREEETETRARKRMKKGKRKRRIYSTGINGRKHLLLSRGHVRVVRQC